MLPYQLLRIFYDPGLDYKTILLGTDIIGDYGQTGIEPSINISLHVGRSKPFWAHVKAYHTTNGLALNPVVARRMSLNNGSYYGYIYRAGVLRLGPVFGIMADLHTGNRPFGPQDSFIKNTIMQGQTLGEICFAFSPYSIDWKTKRINGYTCKKNQWYKMIFPLPDVIYYRAANYSNGKKNIRLKLQNHGCLFINPFPINKWKAHRILMKDQELSHYLPDTIMVHNFHEIEGMLQRHKEVYLKPVYGSKGKNIIHITKERHRADRVYYYQHSNQKTRSSFRTLSSLHTMLKPLLAHQRFIIQKKINLIKSHGRIIDIRVLVQKDSDGEWNITGLAGRMGGQGAITSNLSSGGNGQSLDLVLKNCFPDENQQEVIAGEVRHLAIAAVRKLEESMGRAGEMGIDIGIDMQGKVWFIEANLRPARRIFTLIGDKKTRLESIEKPLRYARYLAGFTSQP